jgi:hypothetical protein
MGLECNQSVKRDRAAWAGAALAFLSASAAAPLATAQDAAGTFQVPSGCEAFLTVQSRSCLVSHAWTCAGDPAGTHWRATLDAEGPFYLTFTDAEFRWLRSWDLRGDVTSVLVEPEEDPASVTELLETGSDTMVFSLIYEGPNGTLRRDYTGFDRLTGTRVVVDAVPLEVTEFTYEYDTPDGTRRTAGTQFFHRDWRMFFGGIETVTLPTGETVEMNHSPMAFAFPGDPGFLSTEPQYDCGTMMSGLTRPSARDAG